MPSNFKALAGAAGGGDLADPNFKNVTLLLHGDGSNGAQNNTFIDSSTNNFTITRNGNTTQGSFSPYGASWSNYFNGTNAYLTSATSSAYAMGTGDFTIEGWFFITASGDQALWDNRASASSAVGIACRLVTSTNTLRVVLNNTSLFTTSQAVTLNQWNHIAIVRASGTVTAYLNGTAMTGGSATGTTNITDTNMWIGKLQDAGFFYNGYISNFRVVKGTAVYTSNFTPPTAPLTAISGTSLLTCQSNRFLDNSTNNFTITRNGDVKVTNFAPFAPSVEYSTTTNGGSAYFDGGLDYLTTPSSAAFNLQSTWTMECWYYPIAASDAYPTLISVANGYSDGICIFDRFNNSANGSVFSVRVNGLGNHYFGTATVNNGAWHHVAVVCDSNALKVYVNGVLDISATITPVSANRPVWIGTNHDYASYNTDINGFMAGVRIVNNAAVYSANFTPPTSPPTAITNTQLLCNFTNAAIFDNSMKNDLETVGNAQISTSVKKFGTGSMAFDGTGDYLKGPNSDAFAFGAGDYTIELWMNTNADNGNVIDFRVGGNLTPYPAIYLSGGGAYFWTGTGSDGVSVGSYTKNAWVHLAVSRSGSSLKFFIDGTQTYSASNSTNLSQGTVVVGARWDAASAFAGYIDDFRITKGVARYTANFTPPTAAFPNK